MSRFDYGTLQEVFRDNGEGLAIVDWLLKPGTSNDYEGLAPRYKETDLKPDKQFSILPTVLHMVGDCKGKTVIDMGCGSGFFTFPIAEQGADLVWGIDNSPAQISLAREQSKYDNVEFVEVDIFFGPLARADVVVAPFVVNYARKTIILESFFERIYGSLNDGGKIVMVVDLPNGKSLRKFGAEKKFLGNKVDETRIQIDLFNGQDKICTLKSTYYTPKTLERLLEKVGFKSIRWHKPLISESGLRVMGSSFWKGYAADTELGYLSAEK